MSIVLIWGFLVSKIRLTDPQAQISSIPMVSRDRTRCHFTSIPEFDWNSRAKPCDFQTVGMLNANILGVDFPFFSTIVLVKNQLFAMVFGVF